MADFNRRRLSAASTHSSVSSVEKKEAGVHSSEFHGQWWPSSRQPRFGPGDCHFPLLPKAESVDIFDVDFQIVRPPQNLTSVINDPLNSEGYWFGGAPTEEPLIIGPSPVAGPTALTLAELQKYVREISPLIKRWDYNHVKSRNHPEKKSVARSDADNELDKCMDAVPHEYFREEFSVLNSDMFRNIAEAPKGGMLMQEKLSQYLDIVEISLLKQISSRSDAFFRALRNIQELYLETRRICTTIAHLRKRIHRLHKKLSTQPLGVIRDERRRRNLELLSRHLEIISSVQDSLETTSRLVASSDFGPALDMIYHTKSVLSTDLKGVKCMEHVNESLADLVDLVTEKMSAEFVTIACEIDESAAKSLSQRLDTMIAWLLRINKLETVLTDLSSEVEKLIRNQVKDVIMAEIQKALKQKKSCESPAVPEAGKIEGSTSSPSSLSNGTPTPSISSKQALSRQTSAAVRSSSNTSSSKSTKPRSRRSSVGTSNGANSSSTSSSSSGTTLVEMLKKLTFEEFIDVLRALLDRLLKIHQRLSVVEKAIVQVFTREQDNTKDGMITFEDDAKALRDATFDFSKFTSKFRAVMTRAAEYSHQRCARIVHTRAQQHAKLELADIRRLFDHALTFCKQTETTCRKTFYSLRGELFSQARGFLSHFHAENRKRLMTTLESEMWIQAKVTSEYQDIIDRKFVPVVPDKSLQSSLWQSEDSWDDEAGMPLAQHLVVRVKKSTKESKTNGVQRNGTSSSPSSSDSSLSPDSLRSDTAKSNGVSDAPSPTSTSSSSEKGLTNGHSDADTSKSLHDEDRGGANSEYDEVTYKVVTSVLVLLKMVSEYLQCASRLSFMSSDAVEKVIELLRDYNKRSCGLVLGAGAMQVAGLKTITAKHLSLSTQCLGVLISQLPIIREAFQSHVPAKQRAIQGVNFDRLTKDLEEHREELFRKIVSIMQEHVVATCEQMFKLDWAVSALEPLSESAGAADPSKPRRSPTASPVQAVAKPDECILILMKNARALRRIVSSILAQDETRRVFADIARIFSETLCKYLSRLNLSDSFVQQRVSVNVSWILGKLRTLGSASDEIETQLSVFLD